MTLKTQRLRQDPFAFFRGTNPLFLDFLPRAHFLFRAPDTLICGDLHLENFGAFKGDNRLCYFDVNDFDEACLAPFTVDLVRFVTGVKIAAPGLGFGKSKSQLLVQRFLLAYSQALMEGKPRWVERSLAAGVFRALLRRAMRRSRTELLNRFTKSKGGRRRIRRDGVRALALQPADLRQLERFLARIDLPAAKRDFFELLDAARRIAGNGSLGLERYMMLVRGLGSPDGNFVLDLKYAAPSAVSGWLQRKQPDWHSEAVRVKEVQTIMQAIPPAMLHAVEFRGRPFVLKELQPSIDRLDLTEWPGKENRFTQAVEGMGRVAAWAHLRGCGHRHAARVETLRDYVAGKRWASAVDRLAETTAARMLRAWRIYAKDYDSGAVTAALVAADGTAPPKPRSGQSRAS